MAVCCNVRTKVRNSEDFVVMKESGVPLLICGHSGVDTGIPTGRWFFGHMALNAELEGELNSKRALDARTEVEINHKTK